MSQETRRKINPFCGTVTSDEQFKVLKEERKKRDEQNTKAEERKRRLAQEKVDAKSTKSKRTRKEESDKSEDDVAVVFNEDSQMEGSSECPKQEERILLTPNNTIDAYDYLSTVWTDINPPVEESIIQAKLLAWYIMPTKKKAVLFYWKGSEQIS